MARQLTLEERKAQMRDEYLKFAEIINKTTENYVYVMDLQQGCWWGFGGIEEVFDLGESINGSYGADGWINSVHAKDRPFLVADIAQVTSGEKTFHNMDYRVMNRSGKYVWVNCQGTVLQDPENKPFFMMGRISQTALRYRVDELTGLFNAEQMSEDLKLAAPEERTGYFLMLGIDNLKNINTRLGRQVGDKALQIMAATLEEAAVSPKIYRLSGDIFALPMYGATAKEVQDFYSAVQALVEEHFTVSGGAVPLDLPDMGMSELLQYSEFTLNKAKAEGKNNLCIFAQKDYALEEASISLLGELMDSVRNGCAGFSLVYQPQMRTHSYQLHGAEALLRYTSPTRGRVFPDEFIPILERSDLMAPVGLWVLETALAQCKEWRKQTPDFHMSVNISYAQLSKPDVKEQVLDALARSGLPGEALTLEVTESMQLQNYQYYNEIFSAWKSVGIYISVDDFGTGYSSLSYLKNLSIDEIKIDRCFVSGIQSSSYNYHLVRNMVDLAADSQIHVCCEGVEETSELQVLEDLKPDLLQGYFFSRPCDTADFEKMFFDEDAEEYHSYVSRLGDVKDRRIASMLNLQHRDILRSIDVGLFIARTPKTGPIEMYADDTMKRLLGVPRDISPEACYQHWLSRVRPDYMEYVQHKISYAKANLTRLEMQYYWQHPTEGEVVVYCVAAQGEEVEGEHCMQGYHRVVPRIAKDAAFDDDSPDAPHRAH